MYKRQSLSPASRWGLALTAAVLGGGIVWFFADRDSFIARGHDAAAIPMFLAIIAVAVSYTHLRAHETVLDLVCRLLLEKKKKTNKKYGLQ